MSFRELPEKGQIAEFPAMQLALGAIKGRISRITVASPGTGGSTEQQVAVGRRLAPAGRRGSRAVREIARSARREACPGVAVLVVGRTRPGQRPPSEGGLTIVDAASMSGARFWSLLPGVAFPRAA